MMYINKAGYFCLSIFLLLGSALSAQEDVQDRQRDDELNPDFLLALSNPNYLVTVGDIYTLVYSANGVMINYKIIVDNDYMIRVSNLGMINATGKTFRQLKREAETIVTKNYPLSGVQLILTQPGIFRVFVTGEVTTAREVSTWAMERLSSLTRYTTPIASIRNVSVQAADGWVRTYDLFKAGRNGDLSQNPYLRPDDIITFNRVERQVTIRGAVERPGVYQLLRNENLKDLIESYACGLTPMADKTGMEMVRYGGRASSFGEKLFFTDSNIQENLILQNYDIVTIPDVRERWPVLILNQK
jgi:protein involved in polysaccharide export with SLBB domain